MGNKKKASSKKKTKNQSKNLNASTVQSLKRLSSALKELNDRGRCCDNRALQNSNDINCRDNIQNDMETKNNIGFPLNHWRDIPDEVQQAYKMLRDGAEHIKATSTKYTLLSKINIEDGSKLSDELRQGAELISTSALLVHQTESGCARATRRFLKLRVKAIVSALLSLIESMQDLRAIEGNFGAQLTGILWSACDEAAKVPQGNRTCMRRELFTWIRECDETMHEFQELINESQRGDNRSTEGLSDRNESKNKWDDFCENIGTGESFSRKELPIVSASLALIKCSRGILVLTVKACECAGESVAEIDKKTDGKNEFDISRRMVILQWMSNLHEMSRKIGEEITDLGCLMYPPLDLCFVEVEGKDNSTGTVTKVGMEVLKQKNEMLAAAHYIRNATPVGGRYGIIPMSEEVKEMSSKLLNAIEKRAEEAAQGILKYHDKKNPSCESNN